MSIFKNSSKIITLDEFSMFMDNLNLDRNFPLAVGVSGGVDSMTLCFLANEWSNEKIIAIIIDHKVRDESKNEAIKIAKWLKVRDIPNVILAPKDIISGSNIQEKARNIRFELFAEYCNIKNIDNILIAHHSDDQLETMLMRIVRGSGLDGISSIKPISYINNLRILRPFLGVEKSRLVATLQNFRQDWIEDSSNKKDIYTRNRFRKIIGFLKNEGITASRISQTIQSLQRSLDFIEISLQNWISENVVENNNYITVSYKEIEDLHQELQFRFFRYILQKKSIKPPRMQNLVNLISRLQKGKKSTLGGYIFEIKNELLIIKFE